MTKARGIGRGGKRAGAGRKATGRVAYSTRLRPDSIAWIKAQAQKRETQECDVVEDAIDQRRKRMK